MYIYITLQTSIIVDVLVSKMGNTWLADFSECCDLIGRIPWMLLPDWLTFVNAVTMIGWL